MSYFITEYNNDSRGAGEDRKFEPGNCAALEDSIMHKGRAVTAGSRMLESFISPLEATVVTRLEEAGVAVIGKTRMDEFGAAGLFADASPEESGAVSAVADGVAAFALCNDYSGSVRQQAAARGVCYLHPTYGTVSRYGLIPAAPSMDQIGVVCKTPEDGFRALSMIAGHDPKDGAMINPDLGSGKQGSGLRGQGQRAESAQDLGTRIQDLVETEDAWEQGAESRGRGSGSMLRIGVPLNVLNRIKDDSALTEFVKGFDTVDIELKHFELYGQVMQILCCAEISSNLCRYDGIKFGYRADGYRDLNELYTKSRTEAFGTDVKLTAIVGAMVLSQENYDKYYDKAMRIRRLIKESLEFDKYDAIILPAPDAQSPDRLALSVLPQLCGLPSITFPFSGGALTLVANAQCEDILHMMF